RVPLAGDAGPREHQSLSLDDPQLPGPVPLTRPARVRGTRGRLAPPRRSLGVRDDAEWRTLDLPACRRTDPGEELGSRRATRALALARGARGASLPLPRVAPRRREWRRWREGLPRRYDFRRGGLRCPVRAGLRPRPAVSRRQLPHRPR